MSKVSSTRENHVLLLLIVDVQGFERCVYLISLGLAMGVGGVRNRPKLM